MRKAIVKALPRKDRVEYNIFSLLVGTQPKDTKHDCWVPHDEAFSLLKKYRALLARYSKMRKQQKELKEVYLIHVHSVKHGIESYIDCSFLSYEAAVNYMVKENLKYFKKGLCEAGNVSVKDFFFELFDFENYGLNPETNCDLAYQLDSKPFEIQKDVCLTLMPWVNMDKLFRIEKVKLQQ